MKICKKLLSLLVIASLILSAPVSLAAAPQPDAASDEYDGYITVSVEVFTIGLGYIVEPMLVGYTEGESFAAVTVRLLENAGLSYNNGGSMEYFFLQSIAVPSNMNVADAQIPDYLMEQIELYPAWYEAQYGEPAEIWLSGENGDGKIGEGDYTTLAGWLFSENNTAPNVDAGSLIVSEGNVYRWMFSIYGYGMDIGMSDGWGMFPVFNNPAEGVNRDAATEAIALANNVPEYAELIAEGASAYDEYSTLYHIVADISSSQEDIDLALEALYTALEAEPDPNLGDVNGDGNVDPSDALLILRHSLGLHELSPEVYANADYNQNGVINSDDALMVLRFAMGL